MNPDLVIPEEIAEQIIRAIDANDTNASLMIDIMSETYTIADILNAKCKSTNGLTVYLYAVYKNAFKTVSMLLDKAGRSQRQDAFSLSSTDCNPNVPFLFNGANDVCYAVLSDGYDSLDNLIKVYNRNELLLDLNTRDVTPKSIFCFRNNEAKKLTPLDIALQYYVALRYIDMPAIQYQRNVADKLRDTLSVVLDSLGSSFLESADIQVSLIPTSKDIPTLRSKQVGRKILTLLDLGAAGSTEAYFPVSEDSLRDPFRNDGGFEIMSIQDFCKTHRDFLCTSISERIIRNKTSSLNLVDSSQFNPPL